MQGRALMVHSVDLEHCNTLPHQRQDNTAKCHQPLEGESQNTAHTLKRVSCSLFRKNEANVYWTPMTGNRIAVWKLQTQRFFTGSLGVNFDLKVNCMVCLLFYEKEACKVLGMCVRDMLFKPYNLSLWKDWKLNRFLCITAYPLDELSIVKLWSLMSFNKSWSLAVKRALLLNYRVFIPQHLYNRIKKQQKDTHLSDRPWKHKRLLKNRLQII